jgi:peptidoglycan/LPS O-acetylase OafA/YrhL
VHTKETVSTVIATHHFTRSKGELLHRLTGRIPSLDGLRTISIVLVIASHLTIRAAHGGPVRNLMLAFARNGDLGVSFFFVISGFLITTLLLRESDQFQRVSLKRFYVRRAFRILPAFIGFMLTAFTLTSLGVISVAPASFIHAFTMTSDYQYHPDWYVGHIWSLSVEEQFYLIWPALFVICSRKRLVKVAICVIVLEPIIRVASWLLFRQQQIMYMGHTRADMLMFGCLTALLFSSYKFQEIVDKTLARRAVIYGSVLLFLVLPPLFEMALDAHLRWCYVIAVGFTLQGISIIVFMLYVIFYSDSRIGRILNSPIMVAIGVRSYSLYLWQQLFIGDIHHSIPRLAAGLCAAVLAAEFSYRIIELPMLRVKRYFESRKESCGHVTPSPANESRGLTSLVLTGE